jgi:GTPase SAR1 family protein
VADLKHILALQHGFETSRQRLFQGGVLLCDTLVLRKRGAVHGYEPAESGVWLDRNKYGYWTGLFQVSNSIITKTIKSHRLGLGIGDAHLNSETEVLKLDLVMDTSMRMSCSTASTHVVIADRRGHQNQNYDVSLKFALIGNEATGKSTTLSQFAHRMDTVNPDGSRGHRYSYFCHKNLDINGHRVQVQVWDTVVQFRSINAMHYRGADGICVFYDTTSRPSFNSVRAWVHEVRTWHLLQQADAAAAATSATKVAIHQTAPHLMLVANKCDLRAKRQVTTAEGETLAASLGMSFMEISVKDRNDVDGMFHLLSTQALVPLLEEREKKPSVRHGRIVYGGIQRRDSWPACLQHDRWCIVR